MAIGVIGSGGDRSEQRPGCIQKRLRAGTFAAMMPNFEHIDLSEISFGNKTSLHLALHISGQQKSVTSIR